ncbi:MAG TPA: alpha/beta hydrolase [Solirubrobacteraceae bacterium]|nr:alpha/beta hydrolase [Solirubrobacteraceae bacterium]
MSVLSATSPRPGRQPYGPEGRSPWLDIDWREHQRWVVVDRAPINTIELGAGPPLVFVHGLLGSWQNWLEQLPVFAAQHRVITLDLPGFGHSPMPPERISISYYARLLDGLFDQLEIDAAALVGNSMGGFVSTDLAITFPERVERIALISPAGVSTYAHPAGVRAEPILRRASRVLTPGFDWVLANPELMGRRRRLRKTLLGGLVTHPGLLGAALATEQIRGGAQSPGFFDGLLANLNYDTRERLAEIACPALIVWGEQDRVITARDAEIFEQSIPGSRKVVLEDTGHLAMLERPMAVNQLLEEFLSEETSSVE